MADVMNSVVVGTREAEKEGYEERRKATCAHIHTNALRKWRNKIGFFSFSGLKEWKKENKNRREKSKGSKRRNDFCLLVWSIPVPERCSLLVCLFFCVVVVSFFFFLRVCL